MKSYRGGLPRPDNQGRIRPVVGRNRDGKPQRFTVGNVRDTTQAECLKRLDAIRDLYDRQCAEHGIDFWANWAHPWAHRLAKGTPARAHFTDFASANPGQAAEELSLIYKLQSWGLPIQIVEDGPQVSGQEFLRKQIEQEVTKAVKQTMDDLGASWGENAMNAIAQAIPEDFSQAETKTLHQALDDFSEHLQKTGKRDEDGNLISRARKCRDRVGYLKREHEDVPLWRLDYAMLEEIAAFWKNRPPSKWQARCSWDHAHDMCKELFRFTAWLDKSPSYRWQEPKDVAKISKAPIRLPSDNGTQAFQTTRKETYTPDELAILVKLASPLGRAIIAVCVNCAFGASEIGQWPTSKMVLYHEHPHATKLGWDATCEDSWIVGNRPKTGVYGEHLLWPEVAQILHRFLDGRPVLPITKNNTMWYRRHSSNPQTRFQNWWTKLVKRSQASHEGFQRLPFGTLRDTLPNELRKRYSDDVASIALQHGSLGEDELLKCYANVPFAKLFEATKDLEVYYQPFLKALVGAESVEQTAETS